MVTTFVFTVDSVHVELRTEKKKIIKFIKKSTEDSFLVCGSYNKSAELRLSLQVHVLANISLHFFKLILHKFLLYLRHIM